MRRDWAEKEVSVQVCLAKPRVAQPDPSHGKLWRSGRILAIGARRRNGVWSGFFAILLEVRRDPQLAGKVKLSSPKPWALPLRPIRAPRREPHFRELATDPRGSLGPAHVQGGLGGWKAWQTSTIPKGSAVDR